MKFTYLVEALFQRGLSTATGVVLQPVQEETNEFTVVLDDICSKLVQRCQKGELAV